jgi:hypothetical protein
MRIVRRSLAAGVVCVLLLVPASFLAAQVPAFEAGVKGGVSFASFFWTVNNSWNDLTVFVVHPDVYGQATWNITPGVALQLELGYAGRGASIEASQEDLRWYFNYVEVPLWLKFSERSEGMDVYAGGGGYVAWMLAGDYDFNASSVSLSGKGPLALTGVGDPTSAPSLDYGLSGTVGAQFGHVIAELRFAVGLPSVLDFTLSDGQRKAVNADIQLLAGWRL